MKPFTRRLTVLSTFALPAVCLMFPAVATAQTVTVDNEDPGFTILYGEWDTGEYGNPHGTYYNWALTTGTGASPAAVEWRPALPSSGVWNVAIWYVEGSNRAQDAKFTVHHTNGSTPVEVNQRVGGETWHELGAFQFYAGTGGYVTLDNDAGQSVVIADAVRFTPAAATVELTMEANPPGWGTTTPTASGTYTVYLNEMVAISADANPGYEFDHWAVSAGVPVTDPTEASTTVLMDEDKTVTAVFVVESAVPPEFRGFWADAFHEGFKSQAEINSMVARAVEGNYNAIVPEIMAYQDYSYTYSGHGAYWNSSILPKARDIQVGLDPLAYLVQQAHANGLEVHPWLVAFRVCTSWPPAGNPTLSAHPEWLMVHHDNMGGGPAPVSGKYTLDPGSPDAQAYLMSIVRELVTNYEIDGIHWDYIRYTDPEAGYPSDASYTRSGLARFQDITGYVGTPAVDDEDWSDFRRRGITEVVRRAQAEIATIVTNPRQPLRHSAALITWGNAPSNFEETSSWNRFQNWREWMDEGYLDAAIPMTYYDWDVYPAYYMNWVDQEMVWRYNRHMFVGPGIYLNSFGNSVTEIQYARSAGADGICTYSYVGTSGSRSNWDWYPYVAANAFLDPAPTPPMTWRDPATATRGNLYGRVTDGLTGEPIDNATIQINGFDLARTDGNGFFIITQLSADPDGTAVPLSAYSPGYAQVVRPAVLIERGTYTEANIGLGIWWPGDYDVDGDVDTDDFSHFGPSITGPDNGPPPAGCDLFDFDADDDVDLSDVAVFQQWFTG